MAGSELPATSRPMCENTSSLEGNPHILCSYPRFLTATNSASRAAFRSAPPAAASARCRTRRRRLSTGCLRARAPRPHPPASAHRCASCERRVRAFLHLRIPDREARRALDLRRRRGRERACVLRAYRARRPAGRRWRQRHRDRLVRGGLNLDTPAVEPLVLAAYLRLRVTPSSARMCGFEPCTTAASNLSSSQNAVCPSCSAGTDTNRRSAPPAPAAPAAPAPDPARCAPEPSSASRRPRCTARVSVQARSSGTRIVTAPVPAGSTVSSHRSLRSSRGVRHRCAGYRQRMVAHVLRPPHPR